MLLFYSGPWDIDEDLEQYKGLLKYSVQAEDLRYEITFMGYDSKWNSADQIPERAVRSGLISRLGSIDDTVGGETYRYSLSNKIVLDKPDSRTALDLYAIAYDLNLWSNFTYFLTDEDNGDQFEQADNRMIYGGSLMHTLNNVAILDIPTRQTIGVQTRLDVIDEVGLYDTEARVRKNIVREDAVDQFSISLFYEGEFFFTEAFRAILGLRYGVEITNYFRPSEWLTLDLDLAFTESEFENGDEIPGALSTVISSGVTVVSQAGLFASLRGRYFGSRYLIEDGSEKSNSSLLFNLRTGYDVNEQLRIELDVLNLFDSNDDDITYFYESQLSNETEGEFDRHFHPIEPRSLRAAVTYRF